MSAAGTSPQVDNTDAISRIDKNITVLLVKLFGSSDEDKENPTGRLPKVEASTVDAHKRIDALNTRVIYASGIVTAILYMLEHGGQILGLIK